MPCQSYLLLCCTILFTSTLSAQPFEVTRGDSAVRFEGTPISEKQLDLLHDSIEWLDLVMGEHGLTLGNNKIDLSPNFEDNSAGRLVVQQTKDIAVVATHGKRPKLLKMDDSDPFIPDYEMAELIEERSITGLTNSPPGYREWKKKKTEIERKNAELAKQGEYTKTLVMRDNLEATAVVQLKYSLNDTRIQAKLYKPVGDIKTSVYKPGMTKVVADFYRRSMSKIAREYSNPVLEAENGRMSDENYAQLVKTHALRNAYQDLAYIPLMSAKLTNVPVTFDSRSVFHSEGKRLVRGEYKDEGFPASFSVVVDENKFEQFKGRIGQLRTDCYVVLLPEPAARIICTGYEVRDGDEILASTPTRLRDFSK